MTNNVLKYSIHLRGWQSLSSLLKQLSTRKISSQSFGPIVTDLPPRCHGNQIFFLILSTMSKPKRVIDLWLVQLGCKHEKCCPQWQKPSYIMKRYKGRADSKENAETVSFSSHSSECIHCEFSNCVCALCNVCPLAPLAHAVAMCSLSRSGVTRKHVYKSYADPQI